MLPLSHVGNAGSTPAGITNLITIDHAELKLIATNFERWQCLQRPRRPSISLVQKLSFATNLIEPRVASGYRSC
jgi:hypothetical protein